MFEFNNCAVLIYASILEIVSALAFVYFLLEATIAFLMVWGGGNCPVFFLGGPHQPF